MFKGPLAIIFIINNIPMSSCVIDDLYYAGKEVWKLYAILDNIELNVSHDARVDEQLSDNVMIGEMKKQVDKIHEQLNELEKFMGPKKIRDGIKFWPLDTLSIKDIDTIEILITSIDEYYKQFYEAINASDYSLDSFEAHFRGVFLDIEGTIGIIRKAVTNTEKSHTKSHNVVPVIAGLAAIYEARICGTCQIISNVLIQLFRIIMIAEMKTSTMLAYGNFLAYMKDKSKVWQRIGSVARERFAEEFAIHAEMFSSNMVVMDAIYNRACDPPGGNWIRGKSFYELETTFQATIFNYNPEYCSHRSCNEIITSYRNICLPLSYEGRIARSRADTIAECAYLNNITACILKSGPYRFQYVDSAELGFLGRNSSCPKDNGRVFRSEIRTVGTDAACVCNTYSSHNKISLLMMESDVKSNRVITGLRFVRQSQVLWIQPREGTLESNGYIVPYSQRWTPIPENLDSEQIEPINKENRVFFLDDLVLPGSFVLTGVKFNKVTRGSVSGFAIEIFGSQFDNRYGKLFLEKTFRKSGKNLNEDPGKSLSFNAVSSVFTTMLHTVTPFDIKYVSLERSTLEDDFGQSTQPLFDAVPITFGVPSALSGVGIFHKGAEGFAGLISLRVYGINYEEYFKNFKSSHVINGRVLFNSSSH